MSGQIQSEDLDSGNENLDIRDRLKKRRFLEIITFCSKIEVIRGRYKVKTFFRDHHFLTGKIKKTGKDSKF